jgi:ElaB/YqjD/DUF883 family membrane-anchored ribosome-binding protein
MADNTGTTQNTGVTSNPGNGGFGGEPVTNLAQTAQQYAGKVGEAATQAKDYVTQNCTDYARKNPGQAMLISAGVGLLLGILVRGRR